mmetsp:Transcript_38403/g.75395  ORF Transcript_38403/g.75395 Transcript_38403/m.75395 type:complete len:213 (-) Transcript_38403:191-829(-)
MLASSHRSMQISSSSRSADSSEELPPLQPFPLLLCLFFPSSILDRTAFCAAIFWSSICFCFWALMILNISPTWPFTASSFSFRLALGSPEKVTRSDGIWKSRKSSIKFWFNWTSLVNAPGGRWRRRSSWGLICTTSTPKRVDSSCICLNAFANLCCSGERDEMASLNSFAVGRGFSTRGRMASSRSFTISACLGSNTSAAAIFPTINTKEEN